MPNGVILEPGTSSVTIFDSRIVEDLRSSSDLVSVGHEGSLLQGIVARVNHISRSVKNVEISRQFYENVVGVSLLHRPETLLSKGCWLWLGNIQLHLIESDNVPDPCEATELLNHISLEVYNVHECRARLQAAEIEFNEVHIPIADNESGSKEAVLIQLFVQDPDKNWIELCTCASLNQMVFQK